ncbi:hypothetical protein NDA16_000134 [Ustilago loliicola]|nr:hypothetical protein NDA16_000134 [Ustilago loliicola]
MVAIIRTLLTIGTLVAAAASASVAPRSSKITFTVYNKCKHEFAPIFVPALPGKPSWPVLKSGKSSSFSFYSDDYRGKIFSPLRQANVTTGQGATQAEVDLESGDYNLSVAEGFNVGMYIQLMGRQYEGYCVAAYCNSKDCADAYKKESGLLMASRAGSSTVKPNHNCPATFTNWVVQFC